MSNKEELEKLLSDTSWERKNCPITRASNLLVDLFMKKANDKDSAIEIPGELLKDKDVQELVKHKRIKVLKGKKNRVFLYRMGKIVAAGEISLRLRERKSAASKP